jgi:hypothetical protein
MDQQRMGLGVDQMELPQQLATGMPRMPLLPPAPRSALRVIDLEAEESELAVLAPWVRGMQLPGVDT